MTKKQLAEEQIREAIKNLCEAQQWLTIAETDPNAMSNIGCLVLEAKHNVEAADDLLTNYDKELKKG